MASKSKKRRRVLGASCILAALIIAGSSFAWFTSKDEVTNRLSASANYGVSIVEDFQPPKNFLPGQKVNKDVAVVNTGNVDAFVRTWIDGEMSLVKKSAWDDSTAANSGTDTITNFSTGLQKTADDQTKLTGVNLNWYKGDKYYKELSQIKSENPENATTSTEQANETLNDPARFSEVQSIQAGGVLVYHDYTAAVEDDPNTDENESASASGAEYYYVLEQATTITNNAGETKTYPAGTYVHTPGSCIKTEAAVPNANKVEIPYGYYGNIDTSQFFPESEGLYLFRRSVNLDDATNTKDDYEYTGYYFIQGNIASKTTASEKDNDKSDLDKRDRTVYNPVYLALCYDTSHSQRSDYVLPDNKVTTNVTEPTKDEVLPVTLSDVRLYTATEKVLNSYASSTTSYTVDGVPTANTVEDDSTTVTGYTKKILVGSDYYFGTADTGIFYKQNGSSVDTNDSKTIGTTTTANGFTWNYNADATTTTYTLSDGTNPDIVLDGAPVADSTYGGYDQKVTSGTDTYYRNISDQKYYKYDGSAFDTITDYEYSTATTAATTGVLSAEYGAGDELIKINVKLANLDNAPDTSGNAETWSVIDAAAANPDKKWTFYYNNDVEEGASTTKLIDYVELDESVKDEAFLAFDFDLNVFMESAQVVLDEQGNETCDPIVNPWANPSTTENNTNANYNAATGTKNGTSAEIESITWTAVTP